MARDHDPKKNNLLVQQSLERAQEQSQNAWIDQIFHDFSQHDFEMRQKKMFSRKIRNMDKEFERADAAKCDYIQQSTKDL